MLLVETGIKELVKVFECVVNNSQEDEGLHLCNQKSAEKPERFCDTSAEQYTQLNSNIRMKQTKEQRMTKMCKDVEINLQVQNNAKHAFKT